MLCDFSAYCTATEPLITLQPNLVCPPTLFIFCHTLSNEHNGFVLFSFVLNVKFDIQLLKVRLAHIYAFIVECTRGGSG